MGRWARMGLGTRRVDAFSWAWAGVVAMAACARGEDGAMDPAPGPTLEANRGVVDEGQPARDPRGASTLPPDSSPRGCPPGRVDLNGLASDGCEYACTPTSASQDDPLDDSFRDDNCDGSDGVVARCHYVAAGGVDGPLRGSRKEPLATVAYALAQAAATNGDVCLAGETFAGPFEIPSGVRLLGGFDALDPAFPFRRSLKAKTTIQAEGTALVIPQVDTQVHVEGVALRAVAPRGLPPGESTYGLRVVRGKGTVVVRLSSFDVGGGADGLAGSHGLPGAPGVAGASGQAGCDGCSGGGVGAPATASTCGGARGGAGGVGGYDGSGGRGADGSGPGSLGGIGGASGGCYVSGSETGWGGGSPQVAGLRGAHGAQARVVGRLNESGQYEPDWAPAGDVGQPGFSGGGGGGGGGGSGGICSADRGGGGGAGGSGGCGGMPGNGGQGGGGSFGIVSRETRVVLGQVTFALGRGGRGGNGGPGGPGGAGGRGGLGGPGADDGSAGGSGGNGSYGGAGGAGAGGAGGPSLCVALGEKARFEDLGSNACNAGEGGPGGTSAGQAGPVGRTGMSFGPFP